MTKFHQKAAIFRQLPRAAACYEKNLEWSVSIHCHIGFVNVFEGPREGQFDDGSTMNGRGRRPLHPCKIIKTPN